MVGVPRKRPRDDLRASQQFEILGPSSSGAPPAGCWLCKGGAGSGTLGNVACDAEDMTGTQATCVMIQCFPCCTTCWHVCCARAKLVTGTSEKGGGNSVNQGFGKDFYSKVNAVKRFGRFTEPPDSEN